MNASSKSKIYILAAVLLGATISMFLHFFKILDNSNLELVNQYAAQQHTLAVLKAEEASYKLAQQELEKVKKQKYQPGDLFNQDISLVNELRALEFMGQKYNVELAIAGLSGTVKNAPKAKTKSEIFTIPYSLSITGSFQNVVQLLQHMEHLRSITSINSLSLNRNSENQVTVSLSANFYLRK